MCVREDIGNLNQLPRTLLVRLLVALNVQERKQLPDAEIFYEQCRLPSPALTRLAIRFV